MIQIRQLPHKPRHFSDLFEEYGSGSIARLPEHQNGGLEVHYVAEGHLHWEIEGRSFLIPPRSLIFTFPWEKHGSCLDFEPGHFFYFAVFRLRGRRQRGDQRLRFVDGFGLSDLEQREIFRKLSSTRKRCFQATPDFAWTMPRLIRELNQPGMMARTHVVALGRAVLCELVKSVHWSETRSPSASLSEQRVLRFVDELRTRCSEDWSLDNMAAACRLKRTQFEILIRELTGDAPSRLLNRFRVRESQRLLKDSQQSVTRIAFDAGFGSSQYFSRVFKRLVGITPSRYRRQRGNKSTYDRRFHQALAHVKTAVKNSESIAVKSARHQTKCSPKSDAEAPPAVRPRFRS